MVASSVDGRGVSPQEEIDPADVFLGHEPVVAAAAADVGTPAGVAPLGSTATDEERLNSALDLLATTPSGREIAERLRTDNAAITLMDSEPYQERFPGTLAAYDARDNTMYLQRGTLRDTVRAASVIGHEGQHYLDDHTGIPLYARTLGEMIGAAPLAFVAPLMLKNPITVYVDRINQKQTQTEVRAYAREAKVATELGETRPWRVGYGMRDDGTLATDEEIRSEIDRSTLYRYSPARRTLIAGMYGVIGAIGGAELLTRVAKKVAPTTPFARYLPALAVAGAIGGAFAIHDIVTYRTKYDAGFPDEK